MSYSKSLVSYSPGFSEDRAGDTPFPRVGRDPGRRTGSLEKEWPRRPEYQGPTGPVVKGLPRASPRKGTRGISIPLVLPRWFTLRPPPPFLPRVSRVPSSGRKRSEEGRKG